MILAILIGKVINTRFRSEHKTSALYYCLPTFFNLGNVGKFLSDVNPTLIKLSDSKFSNSLVRPSIDVDRQLSRFNSVIWKRNDKFNMYMDIFFKHNALGIWKVRCIFSLIYFKFPNTYSCCSFVYTALPVLTIIYSPPISHVTMSV